jgi:pantoate--beta-alanine ligase
LDTIDTIGALRAELQPHRRAGARIGFVPTMGYLHEGHLTLVREAKAVSDIVVVSIFVNPLQFGANEDLARYPRDLTRDAALLEEEGVDVLFAPEVSDMYPRPMEAVVDVPSLGGLLEGAVRPGHFAGVATVVTKLFNIVQPDKAFFGEKDFQQLQVIRRMVEDLAQPVEVVGIETVREADGLAMSSRNTYLSAPERRAASIVPRALEEAERLVASGVTDARDVEARLRTFITAEPLAEADVVAICDPLTLHPAQQTGGSPVLLLLYVKIGQTKLLDNRILGASSQKRAAA